MPVLLLLRLRAPTIVDGPLGGGVSPSVCFLIDAGEVVLLSQHIVGEVHKVHQARGEGHNEPGRPDGKDARRL